jgi:hypothetical protein
MGAGSTVKQFVQCFYALPAATASLYPMHFFLVNPFSNFAAPD